MSARRAPAVQFASHSIAKAPKWINRVIHLAPPHSVFSSRPAILGDVERLRVSEVHGE